MGVVYVTGISGAGKSEVRSELIRRGQAAVGTDEDGISSWYENATGRCVGRGLPRDVWGQPQWQQTHSWKMSRERLVQITAEYQGRTVFVCGTAANEDEVWDLFDRVICLYLDDQDELRRRLERRRNNDFGKQPHELEAVLGWNSTAKANYQKFGAIMVDASQPLSKVVDEVIASGAHGD